MTVLITGANAGIGKEAALKYAENGYEVILFCRSGERGKHAQKDIIEKSGNSKVYLFVCDMSSQASIKKAADQVKKQFTKIDVLINNAANFNLSIKKAVLTNEGIEQIWATNHLGPYLLSHLLINQIKKSEKKRIINICSKGILSMPFLKINFEDPGFIQKKKYSIVKSYYQSKLAQEMTTIALAEKFRSDNIKVNAIKVTAVKLDPNRLPEISGFMLKIYKMKMKFSLEPAKMAETYFWLGDSKEADTITGAVINKHNKKVKFAPSAGKSDSRMKLIELSNKQTGL